MTGIKPPTPKQEIENRATASSSSSKSSSSTENATHYKAFRLNEMSPQQWADYKKSVSVNETKHKSRPTVEFRIGDYLYHATIPKAVVKIVALGLLPRNPMWTEYNPKDRVRRWDASKDGYLSMSTNVKGAGAIGLFVMLRMQVAADIGKWDFRKVSDTEVRTQLEIPPHLLELSSDGCKTWAPLCQAHASGSASSSSSTSASSSSFQP